MAFELLKHEIADRKGGNIWIELTEVELRKMKEAGFEECVEAYELQKTYGKDLKIKTKLAQFSKNEKTKGLADDVYRFVREVREFALSVTMNDIPIPEEEINAKLAKFEQERNRIFERLKEVEALSKKESSFLEARNRFICAIVKVPDLIDCVDSAKLDAIKNGVMCGAAVGVTLALASLVVNSMTFGTALAASGVVATTVTAYNLLTESIPSEVSSAFPQAEIRRWRLRDLKVEEQRKLAHLAKTMGHKRKRVYDFGATT